MNSISISARPSSAVLLRRLMSSSSDECVLDRVDDEPFDVLRVRARVLDDDQRARELERRVLGARDRRQRPQAGRDQEREHDQRELPALDRKRPEAHRERLRRRRARGPRSLSSSQAAPSVTTWSPRASPAMTSIRSPSRRPVRTETLRATPPLATTKTVARLAVGLEQRSDGHDGRRSRRRDRRSRPWRPGPARSGHRAGSTETFIS